jgi:hypothetical protein
MMLAIVNCDDGIRIIITIIMVIILIVVVVELI